MSRTTLLKVVTKLTVPVINPLHLNNVLKDKFTVNFPTLGMCVCVFPVCTVVMCNMCVVHEGAHARVHIWKVMSRYLVWG
jgi:hypothetical protein